MTREQNKTLERLAEQVVGADAIVIGGGSGLSSASGYDHYHWSPALAGPLKQFWEYYGFTSPFAGFYHCYSSYGEQWGYYSQYIRTIEEAPTGQPYRDLQAIVAGKPVFVLTTNVDGQFTRIFPREQICAFQGDFDFCQCSQPCQDHLWSSRELVAQLSPYLEGVCLPEDRVPRCPQCGRILVPWVRDDTFLEGKDWQESLARYQDFLRHWLLEQSGKRVLLLELGVGEMTPSIIKLPFWNLTVKNEGVFYACLNRDVSHTPAHMDGRSLYLAGDLAETLAALRQRVKKEHSNQNSEAGTGIVHQCPSYSNTEF